MKQALVSVTVGMYVLSFQDECRRGRHKACHEFFYIFHLYHLLLDIYSFCKYAYLLIKLALLTEIETSQQTVPPPEHHPVLILLP